MGVPEDDKTKVEDNKNKWIEELAKEPITSTPCNNPEHKKVSIKNLPNDWESRGKQKYGSGHTSQYSDEEEFVENDSDEEESVESDSERDGDIKAPEISATKTTQPNKSTKGKKVAGAAAVAGIIGATTGVTLKLTTDYSKTTYFFIGAGILLAIAGAIALVILRNYKSQSTEVSQPEISS